MRTVFRIETASLVLRPLVPGDTQRMLEMSQEDCARRWLPSQIYRDERHAGTAIEYLMPTATNMRTVYVDNSTAPVTFWVGSNHAHALVKVEPLD